MNQPPIPSIAYVSTEQPGQIRAMRERMRSAGRADRELIKTFGITNPVLIDGEGVSSQAHGRLSRLTPWGSPRFQRSLCRI